MKGQWLKLSVTYERSVVKIVSALQVSSTNDIVTSIARILLKVTLDIYNPAFNLRLYMYVDNI